MMSRVSSSRAMPRKPTSAVGTSLVMPSSMPRPARRIGTTRGVGLVKAVCQTVVLTGVSMVHRFGADVTRGFVGQERDELLGELAEDRGRRCTCPAER